ncbi:glycosyltransferase family 9 protein [Desulfovibrio sp. OttesenSCG-928-F20]|nr:glycosyltransferase family 9 protein [Desulfovibrio sp. OttesenSCG-928-M16]MDL2290889.1 glycosyltransferase family 9 protein [Desulfovibrio sp. OttesenSCG-928-F20]
MGRTERGRILHRRLDECAGKALVFLAGIAHRVKRFFKPSPPPVQEAKRVGVLTLGAIGDLLLVTALLAGLRRALPEAQIEVVTSKANEAVVPLLPKSIASASFSITNLCGMLSHIRAARYDILIDTAQWARVSALVGALSGAARTVGFSTPGQHRHYAFDHVVPHRDDRHEKDNFLALGRALFPALTGELDLHIPERPSEACKDLPDSKTVFCHMWPSGLHSHLKEWPAEYWGELAIALADAGYTVIFTGGPQDAPAAKAFLAQHIPATYLEKKYIFSIAGKADLSDLAFCLRRADAVISVNTGIMHLAAIAGAPTIALNGPTNPLRWGPSGPKTCALLPEKGRSAYLNLGFEYGDTTESVLRHLSVATVRDALAEFGIMLPKS